jgi:hypothetical protein
MSWQYTIHQIKNKYGITTKSYQNTEKELLFGPGQGSTLGPFLWLLCFILIINSIKATTPRLSNKSVDGSITLSHLGDSFIDDKALGCTGVESTEASTFQEQEASKEISAVSNLISLSQEWERLFFSTGGGINLKKSF